ncbi:hypothetical protein M972_11462 [Acetivibrio thermocellus AD2]|uniref:Uncharacterized protein n=2 Tax=Acetivibrio thermocellus TaxID=1515 RepID=G2JCE3_ACET2|nr:hypothetical protein [Acetivibrio thermocellus]CDG37393.1 hypothetical protein CTHBC1_2816 [Acetivibrio thermocellus BC1]ADU73532.1 hypothetical protein Clo1313_0443 [Acetivibrio thermocellus DSM 1313]AEO12465.1 hypothetical protein Cthe_3419 [Acetivibrio thermocellus ATCC 27405]ALX07454.1 hypothetical protein AD2_00448 [Acetivibrio thermocellus AD2]ANV75193.1 hypothetical protein LQRI_0448 [Acetivibrio thermocellus DSM 2360]
MAYDDTGDCYYLGRELLWRMSDSRNRATSHCTFCYAYYYAYDLDMFSPGKYI